MVLFFFELVEVVLHDDFILPEEISKLLVLSPELFIFIFYCGEVVLFN